MLQSQLRYQRRFLELSGLLAEGEIAALTDQVRLMCRCGPSATSMTDPGGETGEVS
jgi:hypothetical protein